MKRSIHALSCERLRTLVMSRFFHRGWRSAMSLRARLVVAGLVMVAGGPQAPAANSPMSDATQSADQRGDLFVAKPVAAPVDKMSPVPSAAVPAATGGELVPGANPLWAIPIARLTATREQPLFAPSRRPPPVAQVAAPPPPPPPAPLKPPEPETPQLTLLGTVAGSGGRIGLFIDSASKAVVRLKYGENHNGWVLRDVRPHQVELAKNLDSAVLDMPKPEATAAPARVPEAPTFAAATSPPPINPATTTGRMPTPAPIGSPGMPPLKYNPPPALVNPFPQPELRRQEPRT